MFRLFVIAAALALAPRAFGAEAGETADLGPKWWQWRMALPEIAAPNRDVAGHFCDIGQSGDTWFLAGLLGFGGAPAPPVHRTCAVPAGRRLFFPVVTTVRITHGDVTCDKAAAEVSAQIDRAVDLYARLDGVDLPIPPRSRWGTGAACLPLLLRADGPSAALRAAADGYWLRLDPLPPGRHTLAYGAAFRTGSGAPARSQSTTYELDVR